MVRYPAVPTAILISESADYKPAIRQFSYVFRQYHGGSVYYQLTFSRLLNIQEHPGLTESRGEKQFRGELEKNECRKY